jgi:hypothetical protein
MELFDGMEVVVTEKMDGENTTMYDNLIHARSIDSQNSNHPSRNMVKKMWGDNAYKITQENMRLCGENMYAEHSIKYTNLESYFYLFSVWFGDMCVPWKAIKVYAKQFEFAVPRVLYEGIYDEEKIKSLYKTNTTINGNEEMVVDGNIIEGYVIRPVGCFWHKFSDVKYPFCESYAKFVRKNHVQTDEHWLRTWNKTKINKLKSV